MGAAGLPNEARIGGRAPLLTFWTICRPGKATPLSSPAASSIIGVATAKHKGGNGHRAFQPRCCVRHCEA